MLLLLMFKFYFLLVLTSLLSLSLNQSITIPLSSKYGSYYVSLSLDNQKSSIELPINLCSQYPIISSNSIQIQPGTKSSKLRFPYLNSKVDLDTVYLNKDNVNILPNINLKSYHFYSLLKVLWFPCLSSM